MAILVDFNQTIISSFHAVGKMNDVEISLDMVRHLALNSLVSTRKKFHKEYGELVICVDGPDNWRKKVFPFYKANRAKSKQADDIDWAFVHSCIDTVRNELVEHFPYKVVQVVGCEGDDVIGTLVNYFQENELAGNGLFNEPQKCLIISTDGDFKQLQKFKNVSQYSLIQGKFLRESDPEDFLYRKIIKGDKGDGVPGIKSADDCFVMGVRQKPIYEKEIVEWKESKPEEIFEGEMLDNWKRNQTMVDLDCTPAELQEKILSTYHEAHVAPRAGLLNYFIKYRLNNVRQELQYF